MARTADVSVGTVHALWQANDIMPHLTPKRYVWKKNGEEIPAKISRARAAQAAAS
jgi:hypothetical protein